MDNQNYAAQFYSDMSNEIDLLEKNIEEYPASSVARFMWLYHLKKNNDLRFIEVAKQTGIYLSNPLWMEYQLSPSVLADDAVNKQISNNLISENEPIENNNPEISNKISEEIKNEDPVDSIEEKTEEENLPSTVNKEIPQNFISEKEPTENKNEEIISESSEEIQNENPVDLVAQKSEEENLPSTVNKEIPQNFISQNETSENHGQEIVSTENNEENPQSDYSDVEHKPSEEIEKSSNETSKQDENEDDDATIPFEPLHTVDYFASQGIKLSEEALANDQLGKQVKSFTAWLKTMKKLHPGQLPEQNEVIEKIIQSSSEVSNQNANVLTEAMADVLVKQGKREKAVEMYEKLSLINPSKSAYFAAKIESLKTV